MRILLAIVLIMYTCIASKAQTIHDKYWNSYRNSVFKGDSIADKKEKKSKTKTPEFIQCMGNNYLTKVGFNELSRQLFSKVVVGADGLPKEGTATSLAIDDETSKLGGNLNFATPKWKDMLFNFGMSGSATSNQVTLYTENAYEKGFKLSGGINIKVHSSIFYNSDSCHKVVAARDVRFIALIKKIQVYQKVNTYELIKRIEDIRKKISPMEASNSAFPAALDVTSLSNELASKMDTLHFIATYIRKVPVPKEQVQKTAQDSLVAISDYEFKDQQQVDSVVKAELEQFELKNAITQGYTMHWLSGNYSFANSSYNIFDTSVTRIFNEAAKKQAYRNHTFTIAYNYGRVTKKLMLYTFGGIAFGNRFALEDLKLEEDSLVGKAGVYLPELSIKAIDVSKFAQVYNKSYNYLMLQGGGFAFFGEKKILGVELYVAMRIKHKVPELIDSRPAYSFRIGPLFSMAKEKGIVSNGTFGLMLQSMEFTPSRKNFGDRFGFAARLSIPFSNVKFL